MNREHYDIPEDHQQLLYIDHRQYIEEELSVTEILGALEAARMQVNAANHFHIMAQMAMETKEEE